MKLNEINNGKSVADLGIEYEGGNFDCSYTKLTSLEGSPPKVGGSFFCHNNKLTSLEGAPQEVGGRFWCDSNQLTSLKGAPQKVGGFFSCYNNELTSLEGAPQVVGGWFSCESNRLTSLKGASPEVGGNFICNNNSNLTSLKDIHRHIKKIGGIFKAVECPIQSHVLGLLLIKDLKGVSLDNKNVKAIVNAHLDGGSMRAAMDCQHELIKAGYPEYAKL